MGERARVAMSGSSGSRDAFAELEDAETTLKRQLNKAGLSLSKEKVDDNSKAGTQKKGGLGNVIGVITYILISSTMLIVNKAAVRVLPYPLFVTNLQMIASVIAIYGMRLYGTITFPDPTAEKIQHWIGVTCAWVLPILLNMKALQLLNVETVLVFRTMTVLGVCLGHHIAMIPAIGLIVITLGGLTYGYYDVSYNSEGYAWALGYWAAMVANSLYIKFVFNKTTDMSTWEKSFLSNAMTVPILTLMSLYSEGWSACITAFRGLSVSGLSIVLLSCLMGLGISVAGTRCREVFSATGFDVLGNMNKFLSIALSQILLGSVVSFQSLCGLVVALCGGILYSPLGTKIIIAIYQLFGSDHG